MSGYHPAACGRQQKSTAPPREAPRTFKASAHSLKCLHELKLGWKGLGAATTLCDLREQAGGVYAQG